MSLSDKAKISDELRQVINDAFEVDHPFKKSSGQLQDFVRSFHEIRQLPPEDFSLCFEAIHEVLVLNDHCNGCYGKGLAYLKLLTQGVDEARHEKASRDYERFANLRDWTSNFEQSVLEVMAKNGVEPIATSAPQKAGRIAGQMRLDAAFPEVFDKFFQSLSLDWGQNPSRLSSDRVIVSLSTGLGSRLADGTQIPQRPIRIFQTSETAPGYSSFCKKARELLNKKGHPTSDHITDALLCAAVFAEPDGEKRRNFLNTCIENIRPVHIYNYYVTDVAPRTDPSCFFGYRIGPVDFVRLSSRCSRTGSDFLRLWGDEVEGKLAIESPEFTRNFVDLLDITKNRLSLRMNAVWLEIELMYFEALATEHFEMMWSDFDRVQALHCALGRPGIDPAIFRQKLSRGTHQISIYLSARGKERGYVVPIQLGFVMQGKIPSTTREEEQSLKVKDSELGAAIVECAALLQQATRFLAANRFADAALYATICLERLFSERGDIADAVARRTAFLCHRARGLTFARCKGEMHSLYDARSRFVHDALSIPQPKAAALLQYARWVLLAIYLLQKDERNDRDGFLNEWLSQMDSTIEGVAPEGEIDEFTLSKVGALLSEPGTAGDD